MGYRFRIDFVFIFVSVIVFAECYVYLYRGLGSSGDDLWRSRLRLLASSDELYHRHYAVREELARPSRRVSSIGDPVAPVAASILFPDWEVMVVTSQVGEVSSDSGEEYWCVFQNNRTSPARFVGVLQFTKRRTYKCVLPRSVRRLRPFLQPALARAQEVEPSENHATARELFRWSFLVYESFSTENDVVLFAKGVNARQGVNRPPSQLRCVFGEAANAVKTAVTSSFQEVFRCSHPDLTALPKGQTEKENERIKISLEISDENRVVPSVAYYNPMRTVATQEPKSQLCASTMVYNAAKFLKEWVVYHSRIGVEKFILYDNGSDDELQGIVEKLNQQGFNVKTVFWPWPKTQESGFSHGAISAKDACRWMMYVDVDEFIFSPAWLNSSTPSTQMLLSLLPNSSTSKIGQVSIRCNEFGPSNRSSHPIHGVTQGYTCRRRTEQRHKSVVLLEAVDYSLVNAIHHFGLKVGFHGKMLGLNEGIVNHYKYQAWSEFKAKFRRRVSAYVVDWREEQNLMSKDRTPGLGFLPIEPEGWAGKFCEVIDERLKMVTQRWFGLQRRSGYEMAWEK